MRSFGMARLRHVYAPLLALFAALGAWRSIASPDAFWHLASGRWMLEHGAIPRHDPFRFTSGAEAWVDHEWGFQLLLAVAERLGGLPGLVALRSLLFAGLAWLLWRLATRVAGAHSDSRREGLFAVSAFALLVTVDGLQGRMPLRPELLTLVFFAALLWLLESARCSPRLVWLAVPLTAVWVNAHPGALLAPGIVFLHLMGRRLRSGDLDDTEIRPGWALVMGLPTATFLALGVNPWGFDVVALPFRIRAALVDLPATNPDWQKALDAPPVFLLGVLLALALGATRWLGRRVDLPSALVLFATTALLVVAVRFQGLVWIAALVFFAHLLRQTAPASDAIGRRFAKLIVILLVAGCGVEGWRASSAHVGIVPGRYPDAGVTALQTWNDRDEVGNLFNSAVFGGYVLYRAYPPRQIFVDTRNEVDPSILRQIAEARSDGRAWHNLVETYDLDAALLRYEDRPRQVLGPPTALGGQPTTEFHTTSALLFSPKDWALVHWDDVSMLFLRRTESRAAALAESEYRFVQPEDVQATLQRASVDATFRAGLIADLQRKVKEDPSSERALRLLEVFR